MSSLHIGTLPKISFKNLTPGLYTSSYGNYKIRSIKHYTQINIETQPLELFCAKRCSCRFCKFHRKTPVLESPWRSPQSLFRKKLHALSLKACNFIKKDSNSCFPVKFVKFLRAPDFKEHLRTTACESKLLRFIAFTKTMANITSHGKVSFNNHLLFHYSRFSSTIIRNLCPCNSANNSFRKWQKPLLCSFVN